MSSENAMSALQLMANFIPMITGSGSTTGTKTGGLNSATMGALTGQLNNGTYSSGAATQDTQLAVNNALKTMMQNYAPSILSNGTNVGSYNSSQTQNNMSQLEGNAAAAGGKITADQISAYQQNQANMAGVLSQNSGTSSSQTAPLDFTKLLMPAAAMMVGGPATTAVGKATGLSGIDFSKLLTGDTSTLPSWLGGTGTDLASSASTLGTGTGLGAGAGMDLGTTSLLAPSGEAAASLGADATGLLAGGAADTGLLSAGAGGAADLMGMGAGAIGGDAAGLAAGAGADAIGGAIGGEAAAGGGEMMAMLAPLLAWIVCTELKDQGKLRKDWWKYGLIYFNTRYNDDVKRAYWLWATPVVAHMKKYPNGKLNKLMEIIFVNRAEWIAADYTKTAKKTWKGFSAYWVSALFTMAVGIVTLNKGVITHWFTKKVSLTKAMRGLSNGCN